MVDTEVGELVVGNKNAPRAIILGNNVRPTVLNVFSLITHYGSTAGYGGAWCMR